MYGVRNGHGAGQKEVTREDGKKKDKYGSMSVEKIVPY
jgi:hypothetical protein